MRRLLLLLLLPLIGLTAFAQNEEAPKEDTEHRNFKVETKDAVYPGGDKALYQFFHDHMIYPEKAKKYDLTGDITVSFDVMEDGTTDNVKAFNDLGLGTKEEAERLVKMLKYEPASRLGRPAKQNMMVVVLFRIYD